MPAATVDVLPPHPIDRISFGKIVQIREVLLRAQAEGQKVIRFESGDPSFSVAPHVLDAIDAAARAGQHALRPQRRHPGAAQGARREAADEERDATA